MRQHALQGVERILKSQAIRKGKIMGESRIPFNKPYMSGRETEYIVEAVASGKICGNGIFTKKCQAFFEKKYGFKKALLTSSCTDALEMAAILTGVGPGDEVIIPSYTFVSTALAFVRQGATIVFADSRADNPNIDTAKIEALVTPRTKVIVPVHYAGVACEMDEIMDIAKRHNLLVVEDAAQAIDSYYTGKDGVRRPLGSIGHLGCFSFHETKNIIAGEGGMLTINDERFMARSEIIWEKGTNRSQFFRGEVNKYGWVDIGSSFLPSELQSAFLWAQIENIERIQSKRIEHWNKYRAAIEPLQEKLHCRLPDIPQCNNAHMFYVVFDSLEHRTKFVEFMRERSILCVFHYLSLHSSPFYAEKHDGRALPESDRYSDTLLRLPMYYELPVEEVIAAIREFAAIPRQKNEKQVQYRADRS